MMSIGYGPKIYLRGPMPKRSYMVASATDLFLFEELIPCKSYFSFIDLLCRLSRSLIWEGTCVGFYRVFVVSCNTKCREP
jgi:hypothetical protein